MPVTSSRRSRWCVSFLAAALLLSTGTPAAFGEQLASQQRGLFADTAYQSGEVDHINLFNGGLSLTLPIGPQYPVGPELSFQLTLSYNSNGWDFEDESCLLNQVPQYYALPVPYEHHNAGFGWSLHLGRIVPPDPPWNQKPFTWVSPDGAEHGLHEDLHPGVPGPNAQPNARYSTDGTYLRMRHNVLDECEVVSGTPAACIVLEFPNGIVHEFHDFDLDPVESDYWITRMRDPFGNHVDVEYPAGPTGSEWRIEDSHGREQIVNFVNGHVSSIELTKFAGGGSRATWTLDHTATPVDRLNFTRAGCEPPEHSETVTVPLLSRVTLPDQSYWEMTYGETFNIAGAGQLPGGIERLRLPTGGAFGWVYTAIDFRTQELPDNPPWDSAWGHTAYGVQRKDLYLAAGDTTPYGSWLYDYETVSAPSPGGNPGLPCYHEVTVTDPLGNDSVHYFSSSSNPGKWAYGLPFSWCVVGDPSGTIDTAPYLSQVLYQGPKASNDKVRSVFVEYDSDGILGGPQQEKNHRLARRRVLYDDDAGRTVETASSDFDGLGHFRTTTVTNGLGGSASRSATTTYNNSSGTLLIDPEGSTYLPGSSFVLPALGSPWILDTWTKRTTTEGTTSTTEACFDAATGFLKRTRTRKGTARGGKDLVTVFVDDPTSSENPDDGFVGRELLYGGDTAALGTGALCNLSLPAASYRRDHSHQHGVLSKTTWVDSCGGEVLISADLTIDQWTGLPSLSRDSAGVATTYVYDALGRLTSERPSGSAWSEHLYQLPSVGQETLVPKATSRQCANGVSSCPTTFLTRRSSEYDGLGRLVKETIRMPVTENTDDDRSRVHTYNALGWKLTESMWGDATKKTVFSGHDRFGRPGSITLSDGTVTKLTYGGDRTVTREVKVATQSFSAPAAPPNPAAADPEAPTLAADSSVYTTESYDGFGRLVAVCEGRSAPWAGNCNGGGIETAYSYDEADRLTTVTQGTQTRLFTYDRRGFLASEKHPEIGPAGNATTSYTYDALGNVLSRSIGGDTAGQFALAYRYDGAGRLISVSDSGGRPLEERAYAQSNNGTDKRKGKLALAKRHNYRLPVDTLPALQTVDADFIISESYLYQGPGGRLSRRQTRERLDFGVDTTWAFELGVGYDALGNVSNIDYPTCISSQCAGKAPSRSVTFEHRQGYLRSVPGFANWLNYQGGGMLKKVHHANHVEVEQVMAAANFIQRPRKYVAELADPGQTAVPLWDSGIYQYDGAGNVKGIDPLVFQYDGLSRLVAGQVSASGTPLDQLVTYDTHGNINTLVTGGVTQSTTTSSSTNRLTVGNATYDAAGNLTYVQLGSPTQAYAYSWDPLGAMKSLQSNTEAKVFLYAPGGERFATLSCVQTGGCEPERQVTTLRGLDGKVLRVYDQLFAEGWTWERDYVYRDGQPLATVEAEGEGEKTLFLHLDHLGSVRQVTDVKGVVVATHSYFPFGGEATDPGQSQLGLRFTGHERDGHEGGTVGDLDYMHARYCSPTLGRFLSVDPAKSGRLTAPQSWNRYSYAVGNPLKYIDPDGQDLKIVYDFAGSGLSASEQTALILGVRGAFRRAGVRNVQSYHKASGMFLARPSVRPAVLRPSDAVVRVTVTADELNASGGKPVLGKTDGSSSLVSTRLAPSDPGAKMKLLVNVTAHEVGHGTGALTKYGNDWAVLGSPLFPQNAEAGSIMEQGQPVDTRSAVYQDFSAEDAEQLRQYLNAVDEPEP